MMFEKLCFFIMVMSFVALGFYVVSKDFEQKEHFNQIMMRSVCGDKK